ncbi:Proteasome [Trypanosoma melophagium]|uniref:Proteasome n=1 Tax=Trypanosoma melophagium TaxID=715481 RepID=UPI00351A7C60|nr:Proteasome [Trypanosoma melophagium]
MFRRVARHTSFITSIQSRHTTILSVRKGDKVVLIGDRQVTLGERIVAKSSACKLRKINDDVVIGFAGSTADAIALMEKLENKLGEFPNQLTRAAVELAKDWRTDRALRRLEASLIVCSGEATLEIDGQGNVITPEEDGIVAIGSGGTFAKAAARALIDVDGYDAEQIARKAMRIATEIDVFSNGHWDVEILNCKPAKAATATDSTTPKVEGGEGTAEGSSEAAKSA